MRLTILGSAAGEGVPALFCVCATCQEARRRGGRDLRHRTAYLWDDVLVDLGPDLYCSTLAHSLDLAPVRHVLITHTHGDHFLPEQLLYRRPGFLVLPPGAHLTVHGNDHVGRALEALEPPLAHLQAEFRLARVGQDIDLGAGHSALPLRAAHDHQEECFLYLLRSPAAAILIANDSDWWPDETWERLAPEHLDVAIIDCTYGVSGKHGGHLGAPEVIRAARELRRLGVLPAAKRVIANHFAHDGRCLQADLEACLAPEGIEVGYDGMVVEIGE